MGKPTDPRRAPWEPDQPNEREQEAWDKIDEDMTRWGFTRLEPEDEDGDEPLFDDDLGGPIEEGDDANE